MRKNKWLARVLLVASVAAGSMEAAEKIRYEEIPRHLAPFGSVLRYRGFNVVTIDGQEHRGRELRLDSDHVRVYYPKSNEDIPGHQISRIEISQRGRFFHHIVDSAVLPVLAGVLPCVDLMGNSSSPKCLMIATPLLTALFSPIWAYTAATGPFFLAADGIAFLLPPKVYEIVH
jgi:hypothetical protein